MMLRRVSTKEDKLAENLQSANSLTKWTSSNKLCII